MTDANANSESNECGICYDVITDGEREIVRLDCSHFLCRVCFQKLIKSCCPFCRRSFGEEESPESSYDDDETDEEIEFRVRVRSHQSNQEVAPASYPPRSRIRHRQRAVLIQEPENRLGSRELWDWNYSTNNNWQMNRILKQKTRHRRFLNIQREIIPTPNHTDYDELIFYILSLE